MKPLNLRMRETWDQRARDDPIYWAHPSQGQRFQDIEACFEAGKAQAIALINSLTEKSGFDPTRKRILDVGSGFGRLFRGFAELGFREIWGVDISPEMIRLGEQCCRVPNARFVVGDGEGLSGLDSCYFDFCFSRGVFAHQVDEKTLWSYLHEIHRTLMPGGSFQLEFGGNPTIKDRVLKLIPTWARPAARTVSRLATPSWLRGKSVGPRRVKGPVTRSAMGSYLPARRTVTVKRIMHKLGEVGFVDVEILHIPNDRDRGRFWLIGHKPSLD